ncbi:MAG TPA: SRPBCC domain-containing protein [Pseudonocardiaceae bacterium]|nr:SRPBCC domain-containing protein [Pseudonocardiaceae bacterium]
MNETPRIEVTVAAPVDEVWDALRDKEKIRHWHGWETDGLDQEIDLIYFSEAEENGRTLTLKEGGDSFELTPDDTGTRITLTRAAKGARPEWDEYYDEITEGWITFLHQLKFALERHPGQPRRTLFSSGQGKAPVSIDGETFFRSDNQVGVVVPEWGDGLLVTGYNQARDQFMVVVTTYGLDDAALHQVAEKHGLQS